MMTDIYKQISKAKVAIMTKPETIFLSTVCCNLPVTIDTNIETACTNGTHIKINPDFFLGLDNEEQAFLLAHETLHVVYMHMIRLENRDPIKWNYAGDYVINDHLKDNSFKLIKGSLYNRKYKGLSTEQVYELLDNSQIDGAIGLDISYEGVNQDTENNIKDIIVQASQIAHMKNEYSSIPKDIQRYIEELSKPKVDWKVVLRRFFLALTKADYSWKKPRKKLLNQEIYLPHLQSSGLTKITFAIDTSGSISDKEFNQFISEVRYVLQVYKPEEIELIQFDYNIKSIDTVKCIKDLLYIEFKGHGGTNVVEVLEYFKSDNSKALIILTDGEFSTHNLPQVDKPIIWCIFNKCYQQIPQGKTIWINQ